MTVDDAGESQISAQSNGARCPLCQGPLGDRWWPHVRAPLVNGRTDELVHLRCALWAAEQAIKGAVKDIASSPAQKLAVRESGELQKFARDLNKVLELSPNLVHRYDPGIRLCYEELKLNLSGEGHWPPPSLPPPPPAVFKCEGIIEMRISSCPTLQRLPPDIGRCRGMKVLVLIANALLELPAEVGQLCELEQLYLNGNFLRTLPPAVTAIPALLEICIDANWCESLPPVTSPRLEVFTAPANFFTELPQLPPGLTRLEMHGNRLQSLTLSPNPWSGVRAMWDEVLSLKLMGNQIEKLPPELALMRKLRILLIANNRLRELPACILEMRQLEWVFAYDNALTELPQGLAHNTWMLERILLEDNPLSFAAMSGLLQDAQAPGRLKTIGLDVSQVRSYAASAAAAGVERLAFPTCISVGNLVGKGGPGEHYYMKLLRSSQLRRADKELAAGEPGGPVLPTEAPAELLVVAFTASQAEPEWLGLLRRIAALGRVAALPAPLGTLDEFLKAQGCVARETVSDCMAMQAALWSGCSSEARARAGKKIDTSSAMTDDGHSPLREFDTLCVVDHCMRWYAADADGFANSLAGITRRYQRVLFVGASMGGFGALLHGGRLADAVLAFGPQARLTDATLRPQAGGVGALRALTSELMESFQIARSRGAIMEVHCAADYHMWHGLQMPLKDLALTVHPLCPRKPFARLLDKVGVLVPIVSDVLHRLLNMPVSSEKRVAEPISFRHLAACGGLAGEGAHTEPAAELLSKSLVAIACWRSEGGFARYSIAPDKAMQLLFGPSSFGLPRAGDWFCPVCRYRVMSNMFFCNSCNADRNKANVSCAPRVPDGNRYPRHGDWGCGKCGQALCAYQAECSHCWCAKADAEAFIVP